MANMLNNTEMPRQACLAADNQTARAFPFGQARAAVPGEDGLAGDQPSLRDRFSDWVLV